MDAGSLGSVHNEDRIGIAGYMEQDQLLQDHRIFKAAIQKYFPYPLYFLYTSVENVDVLALHIFFLTLAEQMLEQSLGMESTGTVW